MGEEKNPILCPPSASGGGNNNITTRRIKEETANSLSRLLGCGERRRSSPVCAKKKEAIQSGDERENCLSLSSPV